MSPADTAATLRLVAELWPANAWPQAITEGVTVRLASLAMTANEARTALVAANLAHGTPKASAAEVLQILAVAAAAKAAAAEPKRVREARRLTGLAAASIPDLADAYYGVLIRRGIAPKHARQDLHALFSDVAAAARPGPPSPARAAALEERIGKHIARIVAKHTPQEAGR